MLSALISRCVVLLFGVLHPAYKSYKALKLRDTKEHVKWMMHWIVFGLFCAAELVSDSLVSWMPFYYEVKLLFIIWIICPITRGSSVLYRHVIHPLLDRNENDIDEALTRATEHGYNAITTYGAKGLNLAATTVVSTVIKGQVILVEQLKQRSYSMNDLSKDLVDNDPLPSVGDATLPRNRARHNPELVRAQSQLVSGNTKHGISTAKYHFSDASYQQSSIIEEPHLEQQSNYSERFPFR